MPHGVQGTIVLFWYTEYVSGRQGTHEPEINVRPLGHAHGDILGLVGVCVIKPSGQEHCDTSELVEVGVI